MFDETTLRQIIEVAQENGIPPARLLAVCEVECSGVATARVNGRNEPLIRFEGHYFDRRLPPDKRRTAREKGLSSPLAGAVPNPASQPARWALLAAAEEIDRRAALESTSWGLGQIMGANWQALGYASVDALVAEARGSVAGQVRLMVRFLNRNKLVETLNSGDWTAFARRYNGTDFRRNRYDEKLRNACRLYEARLAGPLPAEAVAGRATARSGPGHFASGQRGEAVSDLQRSLTALGYAVTADGIFGPLTGAALRHFQHDNGLAADGIAGPATFAAIARRLAPAGPSASRMAAILGAVRRTLAMFRWFVRAG